MKNIQLSRIILLAATVLLASSCNDYDPPVVDYIDNDPYDEFPSNPVETDPSWEIEMITNIGQHDESVFVYRDKKYDRLFSRSLGWNGSYATGSTALPDGNIFWSFDDPYFGVVEQESRTRRSVNRPRNSIMVQTGESGDNDLVWFADYLQTGNSAADGYYHSRTYLRHPDATLSAAEIASGEIDSDFYYQPAGSAVHGSVLQVIWTGYDTDKNIVNTALTEHSLQGTAGSGTYMSLVSEDHDFIPGNNAKFGRSVFTDATTGYIYLYGNSDNKTYVARSIAGGLKGSLQYYVRDLSGNFLWQGAYPTDDELQRSAIESQGTDPYVFGKDGAYYLVSRSTSNREVYLSRADTPYGPFTDQKTLFIIPSTVEKMGNRYYQNIYSVDLHPHLTRTGEIVLSASIDSATTEDNFDRPGSADYYRPYFFRIFNWESLYEEEPEEE